MLDGCKAKAEVDGACWENLVVKAAWDHPDKGGLGESSGPFTDCRGKGVEIVAWFIVQKDQ
jgi:hypothetical protein